MYHSRSISAGNVRRVGYNLADHVGGGGVPNIGGGDLLPMSTVYADLVIESYLLDIRNLPLDADHDDDGISHGQPAVEVSAFNSSISS
jgi:hypothetical protein